MTTSPGLARVVMEELVVGNGVGEVSTVAVDTSGEMRDVSAVGVVVKGGGGGIPDVGEVSAVGTETEGVGEESAGGDWAARSKGDVKRGRPATSKPTPASHTVRQSVQRMGYLLP